MDNPNEFTEMSAWDFFLKGIRREKNGVVLKGMRLGKDTFGMVLALGLFFFKKKIWTLSFQESSVLELDKVWKMLVLRDWKNDQKQDTDSATTIMDFYLSSKHFMAADQVKHNIIFGWSLQDYFSICVDLGKDHKSVVSLLATDRKEKRDS